MAKGDILIVVMDFDPKQARVIIRGVWKEDGTAPYIPPFNAHSTRQTIKVFEGMKLDLGAFSFPELLALPGYGDSLK